jgi:hypothetical protein
MNSVFGTFCFSVSAREIAAHRKRVDAAPKVSVCFLGGTREIFGGLSEDLLGGTGKAEDAMLPGAGIIPKQCPIERVVTQITEQNGHFR